MVLSLGAILVAVEPELTGDVNRDGIVNILDLVEVPSQFGEQGEPANTATNVGQFLNDLNGLPVNVTLSPLANARRLRRSARETCAQTCGITKT